MNNKDKEGIWIEKSRNVGKKPNKKIKNNKGNNKFNSFNVISPNNKGKY
jgi:hypothetical protein